MRGGRTRGVLEYLIGRGRRDEHVEPRLVAGSPQALVLADAEGVEAGEQARELERRDAGELAAFLDEPRERSGTTVRVAERDAHRQVIGYRDAHVWHCSLSLHPEEPDLENARWQQIAQRLVAEMGFDPGPEAGAGRCRWVAVRHGRSAGGCDHIHLVVTLVREDGQRANVHNDRPRVQQACRVLEREFGLRALTAGGRGMGSRGVRKGEVQCDERRGRDGVRASGEGSERSGRQSLERIVRACACGAGDEREFLALLRERGVKPWPRYAEGGCERVVGFSVELSDSGRFGGGRLAKDLTLPALRAAWGHGLEGERAALEDWKDVSGPPAGASRDAREQLVARGVRWESAIAAVDQLRAELAAGAGDAHVTARVAREGAAVLAAWSVAIDSPHSSRLARASRELARSAERPSSPPAGSSQPARRGRGTAGELCLWLLASRGDPAAQWALLADQMTRLCADIAAVHTARGQLERTREMERRLRGELAAVRAGLAAARPPAGTVERDGLRSPRRPAGPEQDPGRDRGR
ncbi:MAG: relaxase/mobilization nuclease domain-containing protein [Solirubrobacteraceae bacterium]